MAGAAQAPLPRHPMLLSAPPMEELLEFVPQNLFERAMVDAKAGARPVDELVDVTLKARLYVASLTPVGADGDGYTPLLMKAGAMRVVAIFSAPSRLDIHKEKAGYVFEMRGLDFVRRIPEGYGAIVDAGFTHQFVLEPDYIARIKAQHGPA